MDGLLGACSVHNGGELHLCVGQWETRVRKDAKNSVT